MKITSFPTLCAALWLFHLGACTALAQRTQDGQEMPPRDTVATDLTVETRCSDSEPGVGEATLLWSTTREADEELRVDVTVFKKGFAQGRFATMDVRPDVKTYRLVEPERFEGNAADPLRRLRVVELVPDGTRAIPQARVADLEPGVTYFWRLSKQSDSEWKSGKVVRVTGPVCPTDRVE